MEPAITPHEFRTLQKDIAEIKRLLQERREQKTWVYLPEALAMLGMCENSLRRLVKQGVIQKKVGIGRKHGYSFKDIDRYNANSKLSQIL